MIIRCMDPNIRWQNVLKDMQIAEVIVCCLVKYWTPQIWQSPHLCFLSRGVAAIAKFFGFVWWLIFWLIWLEDLCNSCINCFSVGFFSALVGLCLRKYLYELYLFLGSTRRHCFSSLLFFFLRGHFKFSTMFGAFRSINLKFCLMWCSEMCFNIEDGPIEWTLNMRVVDDAGKWEYDEIILPTCPC